MERQRRSGLQELRGQRHTVEFKSPDPAAASPEGSCPRVVGHLGRASAYGQRQSQRRQSVLGRLLGLHGSTAAGLPAGFCRGAGGAGGLFGRLQARGHGGGAVSAASRWGLVAAA